MPGHLWCQNNIGLCTELSIVGGGLLWWRFHFLSALLWKGKDWLAQCQDNATEWDIRLWCWRSHLPVRQHYEVIISTYCHTSWTILIWPPMLPGCKTPTIKPTNKNLAYPHQYMRTFICPRRIPMGGGRKWRHGLGETRKWRHGALVSGVKPTYDWYWRPRPQSPHHHMWRIAQAGQSITPPACMHETGFYRQVAPPGYTKKQQ